MNKHDLMEQIFEVIEPGCTKTIFNIENKIFGFKTLIHEYLESVKEKENLTLEDLEDFQKFVKGKDLSIIIIPFREGLLNTLDRVVSAFKGKVIFFSDHHHIYQPDRSDPVFADYIHEKICKECYESMSSIYHHYSVNVGPTLLEWFRRKRPDIMEKLKKANQREPIIGQTYTHQILPLIRNEEDLEVEILAGIKYRDFVFGPLPLGHARGIWLPECTVGIREAKAIARAGINFIILRADQSAYFINTGTPYKLVWEENGNKLELAVFYYHPFSKDLSFDKWTTDNPHHTMNYLLKNIPLGEFILLAHDGELVHHRWEHCNLDVSGFFKELPVENYRRKHPPVIMTTPARHLHFIELKALLEGKNPDISVTELPDFPTSWSCGGYKITSLYDLNGIEVEHLIRRRDEDIIRLYAEMLIIRKVQGKNIDPVDNEQWEYLVREKIEELVKEEFPLTIEKREEIRKDLHRGVNVCYDIRRFNREKVGGAGRWAFGSLDSGDSNYQTYLREAVMLLEDKILSLYNEKIKNYFKDIIEAKVDFIVFRLEELHIPENYDEKLAYLKKIYPEIKQEEVSPYSSKEEFLKKHINEDFLHSHTAKEEAWNFLILWNYMRKAYTSCAYFFDDFNNHVAEDAVIRVTEGVFFLEETFPVKIYHDFLEKLKNCKSRYRAQRNQGPDVTAERIAKIHFNLLRIQKNITDLEKITKHEFMNYIKKNKYDLPHPSAEAQEYYRAFVNDELVGFTNQDGLEPLISRTSKEVCRGKEAIQLMVEKRDLLRGNIISRFNIDVSYTQIEPEKPYQLIHIGGLELFVSNQIEENYQKNSASFYVNNIREYLPEYGIEKENIKSVFIEPEKIILNSTAVQDINEHLSSGEWEIHFSEGQKSWELSKFASNLKNIKKEIEKIEKDNPGIEKVLPDGLEKFYKHLNIFYDYVESKNLLYENILEKYIEDKKVTINEGLKLYLKEHPEAFPEHQERLLLSLLIYKLFQKHDKAIGSYELDEKHKKKRDITLLDAVKEYCKKENLPYEKDIFAHKLWKYQKDKVKEYKELLNKEEQIKSFLSGNMLLKKNGGEEHYIMNTKPVVYVHGAANEAFFEGFYPDNEAIPEIVIRLLKRQPRILFLPGGHEMEGQIQYFRKMQRYFLEKFNLTEMMAGIFACGKQEDFEKIQEKEKNSLAAGEIFLIPSIEEKVKLTSFWKSQAEELSSKKLKFDRKKELEKFEKFMKKADIIYLGGGNPIISGARHQTLKLPGGKDFLTLLREFLLKGGLLMGVSAGAMVMGIKNINYRVKTTLLQGKLEGHSLFPSIIQVHYEEYGIPEQLNEIRQDYPDIPVTAIDTQTAIMGKLNMQLTFKENPYKAEAWESLTSMELKDEDYTVLGSKKVTYRGKVQDVLFDGMKCPKELSWKRLLTDDPALKTTFINK